MRIEIRRVQDGVVRVYLDAGNTLWPTGSGEYIWSDGNYGCDCNRELFFARAAGEDEPDDLVCGETRFRVRITSDDGAEIYRDEDWNAEST